MINGWKRIGAIAALIVIGLGTLVLGINSAAVSATPTTSPSASGSASVSVSPSGSGKASASSKPAASASTSRSVVPADARPENDGQLALTGAPMGLILFVGAVLLVAGAAVLLIVRTRGRTPTVFRS